MSDVLKPIIAHCPYCNGAAWLDLPGASVYCPCQATRVSCDGLNGSIHVTITAPEPALEESPTHDVLSKQQAQIAILTHTAEQHAQQLVTLQARLKRLGDILYHAGHTI